MKKRADEEIEIIYDDCDPKWKQALNALQGWNSSRTEYLGKSDPQPLAELLMSEAHIPRLVAQALGTMLYPHDRWLGGAMKIDLPTKKTIEQRRAKAQQLVDVKTMNSTLIKNGMTSKKRRLFALAEYFSITEATAKRLVEAKDSKMVWEYALHFSPGLRTKGRKS